MSDMDEVLRVAERYGVTIVKGETPVSFFRGPSGDVGCDPETKRVWMMPDLGDGYEELVLHEIVHVVVQPPLFSIDEVYEDWILLPFERELARSQLSRRGLRRVVDYQSVTICPNVAGPLNELCTVRRPTRTAAWRRAADRCVRVDILERAGRRLAPTWRWPDWSRICFEEERKYMGDE